MWKAVRDLSNTLCHCGGVIRQVGRIPSGDKHDFRGHGDAIVYKCNKCGKEYIKRGY